MEFYKSLLNRYDKMSVYFDTIDKDNAIFLISIYDNNNLILRAEYIYIGTFSSSDNLWIWGDQSFTLDKSMISKISKIRKHLLGKKINDDIKTFIKKNYTIITQSEMTDICNTFDKILDGNIIYNYSGELCDVLLINKIIHNNIN